MNKAAPNEWCDKGGNDSMQRLEFAHQLRAIAALIVIVSHFCGTFWISHQSIAHTIGTTPLNISLDSLPMGYLIGEYHTFLGQLGVAVFFLISGFVIVLPFTSASTMKSPAQFIIGRILRIYPVYIMGFLLGVLFCLAISRWFAGTYNFTSGQIFTHLFIVVREWTGSPNIDGVSWTLEVEIYFYLYIAASLAFLRSKPILFLIFSAAIFAFFAAILFSNDNTWYLARRAAAIHFMFLGVAACMHYTKRISLRALIIYIAVNLPVFSIIIMNSVLHENFPSWLPAYWVSFVVFFAAYHYRGAFRPSKILGHFADISYPLYVVHALTGYALMYALLALGLAPWVAIAIAFFIVYLICVAIHRFVEKPMIHYGKKLAGRLDRPHGSLKYG